MATLASLNINNRISRTPLDTSSVPLKSITLKMKLDKGTTSNPIPDREAIEYYALNHLIADLQVKRGEHCELTKDEEALVKLYFDVINGQAKRMFYYLLAICTRENRHSKGGPDFHKEFGEKKGKILDTFKDQNTQCNSQGAINNLFDNTPDIDLGTYVSYLEFVFFQYGFSSSSFGGENWGEIAKVLRKCVHGEMSLELMVDCAYNLSHNNGPIFNKGMWYNSYHHTFIQVLDIQRSGQMPTFLNTQSIYIKTDVMNKILELGQKVSPEIFEKYVDWYVVEASGSVHKYPIEISKQKELYGVSDKHKEIEEKNKKVEEKHIQVKTKSLHLGFATFEQIKLQRSV